LELLLLLLLLLWISNGYPYHWCKLVNMKVKV